MRCLARSTATARCFKKHMAQLFAAAPKLHLFVTYKAPWFDITDALPQFPQLQRKLPDPFSKRTCRISQLLELAIHP